MSKRKTLIELQSKPENKAVRNILIKTKPVDFAPINVTPQTIAKLQLPEEKGTFEAPELFDEKSTSVGREKVKDIKAPEKKAKLSKTVEKKVNVSESGAKESGRLRIFQASTPVTRTLTKFQKAAIVVRGENGKQLVELLWRDQMNEKTKDIWDYLSLRFTKAEEDLNTNQITIRKRDILEGSGVKSDRTFISGIYTLEDMGLIEVQRLSGNKEGNIYILTEEGREELENYRNSKG